MSVTFNDFYQNKALIFFLEKPNFLLNVFYVKTIEKLHIVVIYLCYVTNI